MATIRTGIIGCGKVAHLHAAAMATLPQCRFTAVCGQDPVRTQKFASQYGVRAFTDLPRMLGSGIDAVCICTPHPQHAAPAIAASRAGIHQLIEKPLASSLADCDRILTAAREMNLVVGTVCQRRFYAPCQRIRAAIDQGRIGRPILGSVSMLGWRDRAYYESDAWRGSWQHEGGGVLVNQAPHQLDLLQWYMGPIAELTGYWANLNHPYIDVEDTAVAIIKSRSGALGQITVSNSQNPALYGKVHIHGHNGSSVGVQTDGGAMFIAGVSNITEPPVNDLWTVPGEEPLLKAWQKQDADFFKTINPTQHYHAMQIGDFLDAIIEKRPPLVTGEEGRKTVEIFTAIYRSQRDRRPISFPLDSEENRTDSDGRA